MSVVNLKFRLFVIFFFCNGLYLTTAYACISRRFRSGLVGRIVTTDRFQSISVNVDDTQPPDTKKAKSRKSISFVPSLATLSQPSLSSHNSSKALNPPDKVVKVVVEDVEEMKGSTRSSGSSSSVGELMMTRNRLFLESLKLRKDAIETVLNDPRITSLSSSSSTSNNITNNSTNNSTSRVITSVSLDIEDRWLQLRDSIGMTKATLKVDNPPPSYSLL